MIDILMAAYNGEAYIKEQMESIISQSFKDWNLRIHDDRSSDRTVEIIREVISDFYAGNYGSGHPGNIVVSVNQRACKTAALNFFGLLKEASADYVMFCDQDDVWNRDKIEKTMHVMKRMERKYGLDMPLLVYTDLKVVDDCLNPISESFRNYMNLPKHLFFPRLLMQNSAAGCTMLMNKALYTLLQNVYDIRKVVMHDHFAALTAAALGKIAYLPEATIAYRQHGENAVGASNARSLSYLWKRFVQGKKKFRRDLHRSMIQAGYVYALYGDRIKDEEKRKLLRQYSCLYRSKKAVRVRFYIKNRVIKYGFIRAVMQMIWG